jgi:hypothetical protein
MGIYTYMKKNKKTICLHANIEFRPINPTAEEFNDFSEKEEAEPVFGICISNYKLKTI